MPFKQSLDPENRVLYGESLRPPVGYKFDAAVATTFSFDFETALTVPVSLALFAAENRDEILLQPLALLEGAERIAGRLVIFTDADHLLGQGQAQSRLCSLLEKMIVEVGAPRKGAFHPKIWALRFSPLSDEDPARIRLLVMSRNLTRDRSWDISLRLDGVIGSRSRSANRPLVEFIKHLPDLATSNISESAREVTLQIAESLRYIDWEVPYPFESVAFAVNGLGGKLWRPAPCAKLGVISPFCDDAALSMLSELPSAAKPVFIGRSDELAVISTEVLNRFESIAVLDEMATSEDGEEVPAVAFQGLHAKAFISEVGWKTTITIGSGNATRPALLSGANVELFATLVGKRSNVGSIGEILGADGFGRLTRPFVAGEIPPVDAETCAAELYLREARRSLCRGSLRLRCEQIETDQTSDPRWRAWLEPIKMLPLIGVGALSVWPITRGEDHSRDILDAVRQGNPVDLGTMPLIDLTRFLGCRMSDLGEKASELFSIGLVIDGLPAERHAAILRSFIASPDAFFRYLRLLLSDVADPFGAAVAARDTAGHGKWGSSADDAPLLEEMVRAFCRGGERLQSIEGLVRRLESEDGSGVNPIPEDFQILWESFRAALKKEGPGDGD